MSRPEKTVRVAALKARLSEYLHAAQFGHPVVVYHRDTPVARLVPYEAEPQLVGVRRPIRALHEVRLPTPIGRPLDSLATLADERQSSR